MAETPYRQPSNETATMRHQGLEPPDSFTNPSQGLDRGIGKDMQAVTSNLKRALDRSLHDDPMATLAMAAIVGFVLGTIWKA
jgi:hypothetical protein